VKVVAEDLLRVNPDFGTSEVEEVAGSGNGHIQV
jgi:hypothetical protein